MQQPPLTFSQNNADAVQLAVDDVERITIDSTLLTYYTEMTGHHRTKITAIAGAYLALAQLLLLTPVDIVSTQIKTHADLFVVMIGCVIGLLTLGLWHHAANLAQVAGQRLNILRNLYWFKLPAIEAELSEYEKWRIEFEAKSRDSTSVSKPSLILGLIMLIPAIAITHVLFWRISQQWLAKDSVFAAAMGVFLFIQASICLYYATITWKRYGCFRAIRTTYKAIQNTVSRQKFLEEFKK
jgi:hypothetical protein